MYTVVAFADGHVAPGQDLSRFDSLGRFIVDLQPDAIACLGDLATNDSVSYWDVPFLEQTTLADDVAAVVEAQSRLFAPIAEYNRKQASSRHKQYRPYTFMTMGNHEYRLTRRMEADSRGLGSVVDPISLYHFDRYWQEIVDWKEFIEHQGILFTHCPTNNRGKPIDTVYRGRHITLASDKSIVYAHTHSLDFTTTGVIGNENRQKSALNLPAFMEQGHVEQYAKGSTSGWAYGFCVIRIISPTNFTFEWISTEELKQRYS